MLRHLREAHQFRTSSPPVPHRSPRGGKTKPIPADRRDVRTTCNECRCRSDYFVRASRNFFALQSFFSRISQEVV